MIVPLGINGAIYLHAVRTRATRRSSSTSTGRSGRPRGALAEWLDARTTPDDYIYNFGFQADVYFYAQRRSPTRFVFDYPFQLTTRSSRTPSPISSSTCRSTSSTRSWTSRLSARDDYYPYEMYDFIQQNYDYVGRIYYAYVWQLKGAPLPRPGSRPALTLLDRNRGAESLSGLAAFSLLFRRFRAYGV